MNAASIDLSRLFQSVTTELAARQDELNQADPQNGNHGDHMVEIFQAAADAAAQKSGAGLADAMEYAGELLRGQEHNGSAQVYARGLTQLAWQFRRRGIELGDLLPYARSTIQKRTTGVDAPEPADAKSGEILKALLNALAGWEKEEANLPAPGQAQAAPGASGSDSSSSGLDIGYLFGVGMAYLQAKQKGGDPLETLAETVVASSPLAQVPHRALSGRIALRSLLEAMGEGPAAAGY
jgi:hypothetical protein